MGWMVRGFGKAEPRIGKWNRVGLSQTAVKLFSKRL